jgi:hypothetical protein
MKKFLLILPVIYLLSACALDPSQIKAASTETLCDHYGAMLSDNFMSPAVRRELESRGEVHCTDPSVVNARTQAAMQGLGASIQIMQQSGPPATITPVAPPASACLLTGEAVSGFYKTCFYKCPMGSITSTVATSALCPLVR